MNFEQNVRDEVLAWLPFDKTDQTLAAEVNAMATDDLLVRFYNWLGRLIHPHPRTVFLSHDYRFRVLPVKEQVLLEKIREKLELGVELNAHLSRGVMHGVTKSPPPTQKINYGRRQDLDLLINDWGIHHLHLSDVVEHDGFVSRDDLLLFAIIHPGQAFLLDVLPHGVWTNNRLVAAAVRSWPQKNLFLPMQNVLGLSQSYNENDKKRLRAVGVNSPIEIDGKVYLPRHGGISSAGSSINSSMQSIQLRRQLKSIEKQFINDPDFLRPAFDRAGKEFPSTPVFRIVFARTDREWFFALKEEVSGYVAKIA